MNARLTIYTRPENNTNTLQSVRSLAGKEITFFPATSKYLSWVGEADIEVSSQTGAFELERVLQGIEGVMDAEVITEDMAEEEEINDRIGEYNETINLSRSSLPDPYWYHGTVQIEEALRYAEQEFIAGRGSFDRESGKFSIGLIDTGYSTHPETLSSNIKCGRNFMPNEDPRNPLDTLESTRPVPIRWGGHGTSCAGLIIGKDAVIAPENRIFYKNTSFDDRVNGLLPANIDLVPYRVSRNIISFGSRMADAINHITREGKISVISMSHASLLNRRIYYAATREAYEKGIIFIAAPGSHVFSSHRVFTYPAKYDETIAPAASTVQNGPWKLTHGGPEVDLCAPGFEIYIPWPFKTKDERIGHVYKWSEGSSFAVPIVATAAALWRMHHGERLNKFPGIDQVEMFRYIIKHTATPFATPTNETLYGPGIINFKRMLEYPIESVPDIKKQIREITPAELFSVDKAKATISRELSYLRLKQLAQLPSKTEAEIDFYYEMGSPVLRKWIDNGRKGLDSTGKNFHALVDAAVEL